MKSIITLNKSESMSLIESDNKSISIRGVFYKGYNIGDEFKIVNFRHKNKGHNFTFNSATVNDNQSLSNPSDFNYGLIEGEDIVIESLTLNDDQYIYIEVDYELI